MFLAAEEAPLLFDGIIFRQEGLAVFALHHVLAVGGWLFAFQLSATNETAHDPYQCHDGDDYYKISKHIVIVISFLIKFSIFSGPPAIP